MNSITYQSSPGQSVKFATVSSDIRILANVTHTKGPNLSRHTATARHRPMMTRYETLDLGMAPSSIN